MGLTVMDRKMDGTPKERNRCRYWKITVELKPERTSPFTLNGPTSDGSADGDGCTVAPAALRPKRKRRTKSEYFRGTEKEARIREAELKVELNRCDTSDVELAPFAREWLEGRRSRIENTTYKNVLALVNTLAKVFPHTRIRDLDSSLIERSLTEYKYSRPSKPFSDTYIANLVSTLEQVLKHARRHGIVENVSTEFMDKPSKRKKGAPSVPTMDEMYNLITHLDAHDRNECCVLLCATMGLRVGEALGCKWRDVDFENRTLYIRRNMRHDGVLANNTKTASSTRMLPLTDFIIGLLRERKAHLLSELKLVLAGKGSASEEITSSQSQKADSKMLKTLKKDFHTRLNESNGDADEVIDEMLLDFPICAQTDGRPTTTSSQTHWWRKNRERLGMNGYTMHSLRHAYLSALASVGRTPIEMMKLAGHSSAQMTLEIYTHINMKEKAEAARSLVSRLYPEEYIAH